MNLQNALATANVRVRDDNLSVKTSGPKKRRVKNVRTVRRSHQNNAVVRLETVHFDQKLVQRLLAFIMPAAEAGTAMTSDSVDLVDKDYARCVLFALLEQIADTARTDADEHLDEIGTRDREERHICLTRNCLGQQRLTRSRRAHHQNALRDLAAELLEFLRVFQEFDDLLEFFLRFIDTGDVLECHAFLLIIKKLRLGFAKTKGLIAAGLHLPQGEGEEANQKQERQCLDKNQP